MKLYEKLVECEFYKRLSEKIDITLLDGLPEELLGADAIVGSGVLIEFKGSYEAIGRERTKIKDPEPLEQFLEKLDGYLPHLLIFGLIDKDEEDFKIGVCNYYVVVEEIPCISEVVALYQADEILHILEENEVEKPLLEEYIIALIESHLGQTSEGSSGRNLYQIIKSLYEWKIACVHNNKLKLISVVEFLGLKSDLKKRFEERLRRYLSYGSGPSPGLRPGR